MGRMYTANHPHKSREVIMASVNKVILLGRLGQDPELKYTKSGKAVANFSLATSRKINGDDVTEWHKIVVWDKLAELCNQYLKKGREAFVEGELQTRSWEKQDGTKAYVTEINARTVQFLGGQSEQRAGSTQKPLIPSQMDTSDIPF